MWLSDKDSFWPLQPVLEDIWNSQHLLYGLCIEKWILKEAEQLTISCGAVTDYIVLTFRLILEKGYGKIQKPSLSLGELFIPLLKFINFNGMNDGFGPIDGRKKIITNHKIQPFFFGQVKGFCPKGHQHYYIQLAFHYYYHTYNQLSCAHVSLREREREREILSSKWVEVLAVLRWK